LQGCVRGGACGDVRQQDVEPFRHQEERELHDVNGTAENGPCEDRPVAASSSREKARGRRF
jgi:hypothetical protein